jgi:peptide/nickel transport system substrate-binding protein
MIDRLLRAAAASLLVCACCTCYGSPEIARAREAHTLVIGDSQDVTTLNPLIGAGLSLTNIGQLTMAKLVRYDRENRAIPELATVVPTIANGGVSADGLTITWHVRRGVRWSDGAPFDADDVVFTTNAMNNPKNNVVGRDGWNLIAKIDEPDRFTVRYHLKKKYAAYLPSFFGSAGANPCILPKHILGDLPDINTAPYNALPVGIGPFRITSWRRGDAIEMEANPYYFRGVPKLRKIVYKIVPDANTLVNQTKTGEIDLVPFVREAQIVQMRAIPDHTTLAMPGYVWSHLELNVARPALHDVVVRRALRLALDRAGMRMRVYHGLGSLTEGMLPPNALLATPIAAAGQDIAQANRLLDGAGWRRGADGIRAKDGVRLELDFAATAGATDARVANELIRDAWKGIGVALTIKESTPALFFAPYANGGILYGGKWDVATLAYPLDTTGDFSAIFQCDQASPNGQNATHYCDARMDRALAAVKDEYDLGKRRALVAIVTKRIVEDVPAITMRLRSNLFTFSNAVVGFAPNAVSPFDDMMHVDVR